MISDIQANLPALRAVHEHITGRRDIDAMYHLGDLVSYAQWPNEVVSFIATRGIAGVAGDHATTVGTDYNHLPWHREVSGIHFVNTGSVGRPKDGDWRAGYVALEVADGRIGVELAAWSTTWTQPCARFGRVSFRTTSPSTYAQVASPPRCGPLEDQFKKGRRRSDRRPVEWDEAERYAAQPPRSCPFEFTFSSDR
ncbi:MAG TPA: metallophosphoesterase family protein [Chloroflexia bacterium]|nr:metallophosphoesterase family protein [Chloroflexia bacterium]